MEESKKITQLLTKIAEETSENMEALARQHGYSRHEPEVDGTTFHHPSSFSVHVSHHGTYQLFNPQGHRLAVGSNRPEMFADLQRHTPKS